MNGSQLKPKVLELKYLSRLSHDKVKSHFSFAPIHHMPISVEVRELSVNEGAAGGGRRPGARTDCFNRRVASPCEALGLIFFVSVKANDLRLIGSLFPLQTLIKRPGDPEGAPWSPSSPNPPLRHSCNVTLDTVCLPQVLTPFSACFCSQGTQGQEIYTSFGVIIKGSIPN